MNKELKPCPFCGGKAQLDHDGLADYSYVRCMECHARTRDIAVASYHCSDDKAIELWNHRADVLENVKGQWLDYCDNPIKSYFDGRYSAHCSVCGYHPEYEEEMHSANFCPNCGADMRGDNHD